MSAFRNMVESQNNDNLFEILLRPTLYNVNHYNAALKEMQKRKIFTKEEAKEILLGNTLIIKQRQSERLQETQEENDEIILRKIKVYPGKSLIKKGLMLLAGGLAFLTFLYFNYDYYLYHKYFFPYIKFIAGYGMIGVGLTMVAYGVFRNLFRK